MLEVYEPYVPVLLVTLLVIGMAAVILILNYALGPKRPTRVKAIPYESGVDPADSPRHRFSVKFYMTAILFLVFDLEVVFLYPWAVVYRDLGMLGFAEICVFMGVLMVGFVYAWANGALEWAKQRDPHA